MQIYVLLIFIGLMAARTDEVIFWPDAHWGIVLTGSLLPYVLVLTLICGVCGWANRTLNNPSAKTGSVLKNADLILTILKWSVLCIYLISLFGLGYQSWLMGHVGDWLGSGLLSDIIILSPPLLVIVGMWWFYYPIDRRLREAALIRQIDEGEPVYSVWTRGEYMLSQFRHQMLIMLVPLFALLLWSKLVEVLPVSADTAGIIQPVGALGVFVFAPILIQFTWDTVPLPDGELRDRLIGLCTIYKIKVRELLLWRTFGGMINGAVMGIVGRLRFILLTDALLDNMRVDEVEAVMAHEIAHIKKHHMPWLLICAIASLSALGWGVEMAILLVDQTWPELISRDWDEGVMVVQMLIVLAGWGFLFGYFSRRFERQADTFAVQHFATQYGQDGVVKGVIGPNAAYAMIRSLRRVASLNHHPEKKRSWRHGSIAWRIGYLKSLVGVKVDACSIDAEVKRLKWLSAILLVAINFESVLIWAKSLL